MAEEAPGPSKAEPPDIYTMTRLEQVKVVADPLRVRILELLCDEALTTKQVAERLGEKPTRLYHHVDALAKAGLIRLADTRQVRGTVEKYYRAVAKAFRADPKVFQQLIASDEFAAAGTREVEAGDSEEHELERILLFRIDDGKKFALFNMAKDWKETTNLIDSQPEIAKELNALLSTQKSSGRTAAVRK